MSEILKCRLSLWDK